MLLSHYGVTAVRSLKVANAHRQRRQVSIVKKRRGVLPVFKRDKEYLVSLLKKLVGEAEETL